MKLFIIRVLDLLDDKLLHHRWHWFCQHVVLSHWWDSAMYHCPKCNMNVCDGFFGHSCDSGILESLTVDQWKAIRSDDNGEVGGSLE